MRIGIDCRTYGLSDGDMGKYIKSFISYLKENEDTNEYVLFFNDREAGEFTSKSPRINVIKTSAKMGSILEQVLFPYEIHKEKLDAMLFSCPRIPLFYFGKSSIILSDLVPYFYPEKHMKWLWMRYWQNLILRSSIRKSRSIIAFSEVLKRDIIEIFDTHEEKIHVIPPMYSEMKLSEENEGKQFLVKEGINEKYILSVWELREYKNISRLLRAYNLLLKEDEIDVDLVLIGKEDPTYHEIRSTLIQLGLQSRVHIYNVLDEEKIGLLYQNASLYILPSLYEGSELSILAPLASKLPIVSSSLPSITPLLSKDDAVFFRPMSIPEMKEALKKTLSNPSIEQRKRDMSTYSVPSVSTEILDVLSLCKQKIDTWILISSEEKTNL